MRNYQTVDISIIIPALNEEKNIKNLLEDIKIQKSGFHIETIVADGGSKDRTREIAEEYGATVVPGGMPAHARNAGAKIAKGHLLYFMDSDIRIKKDFLRHSFMEMMVKGYDAAVMDNQPVYNGDEKPCQKILVNTFNDIGNVACRYYANTDKPKGIGTCMLFNREVFNELGGFNEKSYWGEDSEIAENVFKFNNELGMREKFGVLKDVEIYTHPRKPLEQGILKFYFNAMKLLNYRKKHGNIDSKEKYQKITGIKDYFHSRKNGG